MGRYDPYLALPLTPNTQDLYHVRTSIRQALRSQLPRFRGSVLDIGCGTQPYRRLLTSPPSSIVRYVGMDLGANPMTGYRRVTPDITWDGRRMPVGDASFDRAVATEVLEHCPDPAVVLRETHRVLRPGGMLFFTVPFLWPLHDVPHDEFRYTPFALERMLRNTGFHRITLGALGGWDASLAQMLGLWVLRRPMTNWKRRMLKRLTLPVVRTLLKRDHIPDPGSSPMITGVWGTAFRP